MAFGDIVQQLSANDPGTGFSQFTISCTGTPGNLLVFQASVNSVAAQNFTMPGYIEQNSPHISNRGAVSGYKIATGSDDLVLDWQTNAKFSCTLVEYEGPFDEAQLATPSSESAYASVASSSPGAVTPSTAVDTLCVSIISVGLMNTWSSDNANPGSGTTVTEGYAISQIISTPSNNSSTMSIQASKVNTDQSLSNMAWNSGDVAGDCVSTIMLFPGTVVDVGTNWTPTDVDAQLDAVGLDGQPDSATTLTATAPGGSVVADSINMLSANQVGRWFLKGVTVTGAVEVTLDGSTWTAVPALSETEFTEVMTAQVLSTITQGIRFANSGDSVIVGNAEILPDTDASSVAGTEFIYTVDNPVSQLGEAGRVQTGAWTPGAVWGDVPANSRYYGMNEGEGDTLHDTIGGQDGTIQNPGSSGGGWD